MIVLIDGYNVLKQVLQLHISAPMREQFIKQLGRYGAIKGHKIVLVFDAGPFDRPVKERVGNVSVVYSGVKESADDYLRDYMDRHATSDIVLISSDRALRNHAARLNLESLAAVEFYQLLQHALNADIKKDRPESSVVKMTEEENADLDALMMGSEVQGKSEDLVGAIKNRTSSGRAPSKQERALLKKINKL